MQASGYTRATASFTRSRYEYIIKTPMGRKPLILESNFPFLHPRPPLSLDELNSMAALIVTQILFLLTMPLVCRSAFTNASDSRWCWGSNCVEQKSPGHICYFPAGNQTNATSCSGGHSGDSEYQAVLIAHLSQSLSIGYYMPVTNTWLGGVNYSLSSLAPNTSITLCLSGQVGLDNEYQTLCESANADNDITLPGPYCIVTIAQHYVSDHCYTAMPNQTTASNVTSRR